MFYELNPTVNAQFEKTLKPCPCCGNKARYMAYRVFCSVCGMSGPQINLPHYYWHGNAQEGKLAWRLFYLASKPWNFRGRIIQTDGPLEKKNV